MVVDNATLSTPQAGFEPRIDEEVPVTARWHARVALAGTAVFTALAIATSAIPSAAAQDATPVAQPVAPARPAHIHSGDCVELGDVVAPLTDLTAPVGEGAGQAGEASPAESSFTSVPMTLDAILGADHAINVHLSAEQIDTYIACGELGGVVDAGGALVVGLREQSDSGYTGIAFLSPGVDGASTDVSVFIAPVFGAAG